MRTAAATALLLAAGHALAADYPAPAGGAVAKVTNCEAAVEILTGPALLGRQTYGGSCVAHAAWTPDGRFFVFSLYDSDGHQPWNSPIEVFSIEKKKFLGLVGDSEAITDPDFVLSAPSGIEFETTRIPLDDNRPTRRRIDLKSLD